MKSFLKKLGSVLAGGLGLVATVFPILRPFLGGSVAQQVTTGVNDFTAIGQIVVAVEAIGQNASLTGPQKFAAALPLVTNIVRTSEMVAGKKIADEATFIKGCQEITQGVVDILNGVHPDAAASVVPTP